MTLLVLVLLSGALLYEWMQPSGVVYTSVRTQRNYGWPYPCVYWHTWLGSSAAGTGWPRLSYRWPYLQLNFSDSAGGLILPAFFKSALVNVLCFGGAAVASELWARRRDRRGNGAASHSTDRAQ